MLGHPDRATDLANVAFMGEAEERAETRLRAGPSGLGLTLGHYGRRDRVFAYGALAEGIFADGILADRRRGDRLRPREVSGNCCSHESQRSDTKNHEFQHRIVPHCESRSLESTKVKLDPTMATVNETEELAVRTAVFCQMLRKWHEIRGAGRRSRRGKGGRSTGPRRAAVSFCPDA